MNAAGAADLLRGARRAVALTGAGVSTESGLPDFRSSDGLWAGVDPSEVASRSALERHPEAFFAFYRERLARLAAASPNPAHRALAALERAGCLRAIITQNIDGLHQAAGSRAVVEIHGNLREAVCLGCGATGSIEPLRAALAAGTLPRCGRCGGLLKPNVVLFEDPMPEAPWQAACEAARACDLMLVVGSSLQVTPAAYLPSYALEAGARLVIVNREETPYDAAAAVTIRGDAGTVLPAVAAALGLAPLCGEEAPAGAPN